jgi:hypothetical protein
MPTVTSDRGESVMLEFTSHWPNGVFKKEKERDYTIMHEIMCKKKWIILATKYIFLMIRVNIAN